MRQQLYIQLLALYIKGTDGHIFSLFCIPDCFFRNLSWTYKPVELHLIPVSFPMPPVAPVIITILFVIPIPEPPPASRNP